MQKCRPVGSGWLHVVVSLAALRDAPATATMIAAATSRSANFQWKKTREVLVFMLDSSPDRSNTPPTSSSVSRNESSTALKRQRLCSVTRQVDQRLHGEERPDRDRQAEEDRRPQNELPRRRAAHRYGPRFERRRREVHRPDHAQVVVERDRGRDDADD